MQRHTYKGITFAENWNGTFEQFKAEFEFTAPFKGLQSKQRLAELKRVFNHVTKEKPSHIEDVKK